MKKFNKFERYEFCGWDISKKAYEVYSNSDFAFYKHKDTFFVADNQSDLAYEIGTLKGVEEFLLQFAY